MKLRRCVALVLTATLLLPCALPAVAAAPHRCPHGHDHQGQHEDCSHCPWCARHAHAAVTHDAASGAHDHAAVREAHAVSFRTLPPCALDAPCDAPRARLTKSAPPIPTSPPAPDALPPPLLLAAHPTPMMPRSVWTPVTPPTPPPQPISAYRT